MRKFSLQEFKPTILFLVKFIGIYLAGNLLYGLYVTSYEPQADPLTKLVTVQTKFGLNLTGIEAEVAHHMTKATVILKNDGRAVVSVYEGCNGINIFIIYAAFLVAFGPYKRPLAWYIPSGILVIHFFNLIRIGGLFMITLARPDWLYFTHKYLFTAFIYAIVFLLWLLWFRICPVNKV
jgi:exosortase family protein XrtF